MKIVHAIFSFNVGGAETMLVDIINQQCKEASVDLIIVNNKVNRNLLNTIDSRVTVFLLGRKESDRIQLLPVFFKINQIINQIKPDVIHCHDNKLFPFFIKWKKKTCLTIHNVRLSTSFLKNYNRLFAISIAVQRDLKNRLGITTPVVYNGIEIGQYKTRCNYDFNPEKEEFKIVQLSRLFPEQKGQHIAIQAMNSLIKQNRNLNVKLYFVGSGESLEKLKELVAEQALCNHVLFLGQVDRQWVKDNLQNYHLLIQPSLYEGFGLTVVEGFASGLPVIASDLDGPKEIVEILDSGLLVKPNEPDDLTEKIAWVIDAYNNKVLDRKRYINKGDLHRFDIRTTAKNYIQLYSNH